MRTNCSIAGFVNPLSTFEIYGRLQDIRSATCCCVRPRDTRTLKTAMPIGRSAMLFYLSISVVVVRWEKRRPTQKVYRGKRISPGGFHAAKVTDLNQSSA